MEAPHKTVLDAILRRFVAVGRLDVRWPDGDHTSYRGADGPRAAIRIADAATARRLILRPDPGFGEAYMDGRIEPEGCSIHEVLDVAMTNTAPGRSDHPAMRLRMALARLGRRIAQRNQAARSERNVRHHYDLNGRLYSLFLDRDRQ